MSILLLTRRLQLVACQPGAAVRPGETVPHDIDCHVVIESKLFFPN